MDLQPAIVANGSAGTVSLAGRTIAMLFDWNFVAISKARGWVISAEYRSVNDYWLRQALGSECQIELEVRSKRWIFKNARIELAGTNLRSGGFEKPEMR